MMWRFTDDVASINIPFPRAEKSIRYRYEKAIVHPMNELNGLKFCTLPEKASGKQTVSRDIICKYLKTHRKEEFEKSETLFGSPRSALSVVMS